ncbi:MAG: polyphosphate kinase 1 [Bacteroidota bacterium]
MKEIEENTYPYIHRDVSWLSFNYRVLQEAKDPSVPLYERIKFLAIYSSNLDEFFRVRVAGLRNLVRVSNKTKKQLDFDPEQILKRLRKIVNKQQEEYGYIFKNQIVPQLKEEGIHLMKSSNLNEEQHAFIENYFQENLLPFVQPVLLVKRKIRPFLNNAALYLALLMEEQREFDSKQRYAILKIPSDHLPRFVRLPSTGKRHDIMMLDDIVRISAQWIFPGYRILNTYSIKLTRDAELYIEDEFSGDLIQKIKKSLSKRNVGPPSRLVYDRKMSEQLLDFLMETFELDNYDLLAEGRYHNNFDFFSFPDFGYHHLKNTPLPPIPYRALEESRNLFAELRKKDHLIHVPYQSYESVIRFFETASRDPKVTHIKIVQYRVAKNSRIMTALMDAVKAGKQVSVFVEVKARFDEEANLMWGERLEKAGVSVHYSFPGLKVHSKIALVAREERGKTKLYAYLSTGNFHEGTAKIYSDFGLFTVDERLTTEVARVFSFLETVKVPRQKFRHLLVGQFNLRTSLVEKIDREIENAQNGKPASIILKMNSLQDKKMVIKLYEASNEGVKITMIIRGICCLVPGMKGLSENIQIISIVDRFLEHSRIFIFHNDGDQEIYLSSADWMARNLSYRIETTFPIYDEEIRQEILNFIDIQLRDNVKARIIDRQQKNEYFSDNLDLPVRAQKEMYYYLKRKEEQSTSVRS